MIPQWRAMNIYKREWIFSKTISHVPQLCTSPPLILYRHPIGIKYFSISYNCSEMIWWNKRFILINGVKLIYIIWSHRCCILMSFHIFYFISYLFIGIRSPLKLVSLLLWIFLSKYQLSFDEGLELFLGNDNFECLSLYFEGKK
jgi:hypothetical protein